MMTPLNAIGLLIVAVCSAALGYLVTVIVDTCRHSD